MKRLAGSGVSNLLKIALAVLMFGPSERALPTGFFLNQQSVKGLGRVDAGNTAAADDLGTIYFNPAGLIEVWRQRPEEDFLGSLGLHLIVPRSEITNSGSTATSPGTLGAPVGYAGPNTKNPTNPTPVPNLYLARKLAEGRGAIGLGVNVPFGLTTESSSDWFGRYDAIEASLKTINIGLVGAYQITPDFSVGGGLDAQYAETKLVTAVPDPLAAGGPSASTDARAETSGHAWTPGYNLGLIYDAGRDSQIGVHYRSGMTHKIVGSTTTTGLTGPLAALNGTVGSRADLKLPSMVNLGVLHRATPSLTLLGELEWFNWSTFKEIRIRFDNGNPDAVRQTNYRNTLALALGAAYQDPNSPLTMRGGIQIDQTPTTDGYRDTTVPDADRLWLGFGASYRWSKRTSLDFAFSHVFFRKTDIAVTRTFFDGTPLRTTVLVNGRANSSVDTISLDLRGSF